MRWAQPHIAAAVIAAALSTVTHGQVVINMPPPPPAPAAPVQAPDPIATTTFQQDAARRNGDVAEVTEVPEVGTIALARYAGAHRGPRDTYGPSGPYGGWVAGYGYYPLLGFSTSWSGWGWNRLGWGWGGWGWGWPGWGWGGGGFPCFSSCGVRSGASCR